MSYSVPVKGWPLGIDNVQPEYAVDAGALRSAVNVDIHDGGKLKRRKGITEVALVAGAHSMWSDSNLSVAYYAAGSSIYSFTAAGVSTAIVTGLTASEHVAFYYLHGEVFWSNNVTAGRIRGGVNYPWGLETPASQPVLTATAGALEAGTYQITVVYKNALGEESGAQNAVSITLASTGGIAITAIPVPVNASITTKDIYMTPQNGDVLYKVASILAAQTSYTVATAPVETLALKTQGLSPMPSGTIIAHHKGRMFTVVGRLIFYSDPLRYGLHDATVNFFMYPSDVTVMLAEPAGLYVVADKTYFLTNPGQLEVEQRVILPFGAAAGTGVYLSNSTDVAWFSHRGQVVASGGEAKVITEKHFAPDIMTRGASLLREQDGIRQIINVAHQAEANSLAYTGA